MPQGTDPAVADVYEAEKARAEARELQRMLDEVGAGWRRRRPRRLRRAAWAQTLPVPDALPSPPCTLTHPAALPALTLPLRPHPRQVNHALTAEREAKKAAEKDRALVQIVLDAKQRLADAMREEAAAAAKALAAERAVAAETVDLRHKLDEVGARAGLGGVAGRTGQVLGGRVAAWKAGGQGQTPAAVLPKQSP